jgi:hypothetical protein
MNEWLQEIIGILVGAIIAGTAFWTGYYFGKKF